MAKEITLDIPKKRVEPKPKAEAPVPKAAAPAPKAAPPPPAPKAAPVGDTVTVNKSALYRLIYRLMRHGASTRGANAKNAVAGMFNLTGQELEAKWDEIKAFIIEENKK